MTDKATLNIGDKSYDLPILKGSTGPDVVDVRKLYGEADVFTYDPGFTSTASCESKITYIDGDAGVLLHRGYPIDQLAEKSSFLEVCYLLLNGELPTAPEFAEFERNITYHTMLHAQFDRFFSGFRSDAHPMAIMTGAVGALSAFYADSLNVDDPKQREISAHRLIAKMPTIAARAFQYSQGRPFVSPRNDLSYAENFLRMSFSVPAEDWKPNPVLTRAMDRIFILHADHEQIEHFVAGLLHDLGARVVVLVDPVAEAHQLVFAVFDALDVVLDVVDAADDLEHLQGFLVRPAMARAPQAGDAGGDAGERVRARRAG